MVLNIAHCLSGSSSLGSHRSFTPLCLCVLSQWRAEAPEGLPGWTEAEREALSDELSDVLIYLVALADKCRVDLPSAALRKIEKNHLKYPAEKVYGSSKKYTEYQE